MVSVLLSLIFKDNEYVKFGLLTGIYNSLQREIGSGLNNIKVMNIANGSVKVNPYFGFTK